MRKKEFKTDGPFGTSERSPVYTNIYGTTLTVEGENEDAAMCIIAEMMASDLAALSEDPSMNRDLSKLDGVQNGLYQAAFKAALSALGNGAEIPWCVRDAAESLQKEEESIRELCNKMDADGVYPGSAVFGNLMNIRYYVNKWREHLLAMMSLANAKRQYS